MSGAQRAAEVELGYTQAELDRMSKMQDRKSVV